MFMSAALFLYIFRAAISGNPMNPLTYMHNPLFLSDMAAFYVTVHSVHSNPFISLMVIIIF
jgi:hypothetical protein